MYPLPADHVGYADSGFGIWNRAPFLLLYGKYLRVIFIALGGTEGEAGGFSSERMDDGETRKSKKPSGRNIHDSAACAILDVYRSVIRGKLLPTAAYAFRLEICRCIE
jgi:hypothetical protein